MQKFYDIVLFNGEPLAGASVYIYNYPSGSLATIYVDNGITQGPNPITTDVNGGWYFYAANGRYSRSISYPNTPTITVLDFPLENDPANGQPVVITGGSIDNTPIGSTTPSTATFTTLGANGQVTFNAGIASTSTTTGTLVITGGLGISGSVWAAGFNGPLGSGTPAAASVTTLTASSTVSGTGITSLFASPPAIGATAAAAGTFTNLAASNITLTPGSAPTANGEIIANSTQLALQTENGSLVTAVPGILFTQTATVTTSGTTASSWLGAGTGTLTLPNNYLAAGKTLMVTAMGTFTTAATPGTVTLSAGIGSNTIFTTGANTPVASLSNALFKLTLIITGRTTGSSGTCAYTAELAYANSTPAWQLLYAGTASSSVSINTTSLGALALSTTNSVSGGAVFTIDTLTVEVKQ
jgi:hypothetical protein